MASPNRSVMEHKFSRVPQAETQRSSFDRSHGHKTTFDAGYLVPIYVDEVLPGDTFKMNMTGFARMATPIKPVMDNMYMDTFFFFVPNRLVWDDWQKFMGEEEDPGDSVDPIAQVLQTPKITLNPNGGADEFMGAGSLYDYFGLPVNATGSVELNALPIRGYQLIWNEWFRDQNLQNSISTYKGSDPASPYSYTLLRRGKRHDYFTSCLPWPSKNEEAVVPTSALNDNPLFVHTTSTPTPSVRLNIGPVDGSGNRIVTGGQRNIGDALYLDSGVDIPVSDIRIAFGLQRLLERDARGGTRYTEIIKAHFGVTSPDARLQRPEYLGGGSSRVTINAVAQNAATTQDSPQGNLAAVGTAALNRHGFTASFTEHGYIIGLVNVRADLTYQEGMNRMWFKSTKYDYFWPALAHLGEQEVFTAEIYAINIDVGPWESPVHQATNPEIFGYQERYAEYRYKPSLITGLFRSNHPQSLDIWHLSQDFASEPALNAEFIEDNPPIDRVIAVPSEPHFIADFFFDLKCVRPMPLYGVPGYIDHF